VQGPIINFSLKSPQGETLSYKAFEEEAADAGFHLRTGAECNPGACYAYLGARVQVLQACATSTPARKGQGCEGGGVAITLQ